MGEQEVLLVIFATYDEHIPRTGKDLCTGIKNDRSPDVGAAVIFLWLGQGAGTCPRTGTCTRPLSQRALCRGIKKAPNVIKPDIQS